MTKQMYDLIAELKTVGNSKHIQPRWRHVASTSFNLKPN